MKDFGKVFREINDLTDELFEELYEAGAASRDAEIEELKRELSNLKSSGWVSVKDKLPDDGQIVFASGFDWGDKNNKRHFMMCEYFKSMWIGERDEEFIYTTHWASIPELGELT